MSHSACSRCGCAIAECECALEVETLPTLSFELADKLEKMANLANKLENSKKLVRQQRATQKRKRVLN